MALDPRLVSHDWIMTNVFGFSEKEIHSIKSVLQYTKEDARLRSMPPPPSVVAELQLDEAIRYHDEQEIHPS